MTIFIDTWGFKALMDSEDEHHDQVVKLFDVLWKNNSKLITSDYVLDETITLLSVRAGMKPAKEFSDIIINGTSVDKRWIEKRYFYDALEMKFRYDDKPKISFTDFTSMSLMLSTNVKYIVTNDRHFESVNLGLKLVREEADLAAYA